MCLSDTEIADKTFNLAMIKAFPSILGEDRTKVIDYSQDLTHYYHLDPTHEQTSNLYFMESTIRLKDNVWDFFEFTERDQLMYEHSYSQHHMKWMPLETPNADRKYVSIYLRQDSQ